MSKNSQKWVRGKVTIAPLTVREIATLIELLHSMGGNKRILKKLVKASDWYFDYPFVGQ